MDEMILYENFNVYNSKNSCLTDLDDFCHGELLMCVSISGQNGTVERFDYLNMQTGSKRFFFFSFFKNPFNPDFNFQSLMKS